MGQARSVQSRGTLKMPVLPVLAAKPSPSPRRAQPDRPTDIPRRSWGHVVGRVGKQVKHHNLTDRAATLTYYGLLALFPGLLVVVSLLGFVGPFHHQPDHPQPRTGCPRQRKVPPHGDPPRWLAVRSMPAELYLGAFMRASNAIYNVDEGHPGRRKSASGTGSK